MMNTQKDSQNSYPSDAIAEPLKQFAVTTRNLFQSLSRYFTNLSEKFLPLTEDKFELWEDDIKANTFLYRLLNSASKGHSRIDADLLEEIRQFIGPWTPQQGEEHFETARADWRKLLEGMRGTLASYGKTFEAAIQTSAIIANS
jgi:hypothetical protein